MNDLDLLVAGAMVSFLTVAAAYIAIRHRANELPVDSYGQRRAQEKPQSVPQPHESVNQR